MRITVGPLPPEWSGPKVGGVATFHRLLLEQLGPDHSIAGIRRADPKEVETIRPPKSASLIGTSIRCPRPIWC